MSRDRTACMMRVRNEGKWIRRSLERTFQVAKTVVIYDDNSTDDTLYQAHAAMHHAVTPGRTTGDGVWTIEKDDRVLHVLISPFRPSVRPYHEVNEIRDKNFLWYACKSRVDFDYMLCLDGDEMLSLEAIKAFPKAVDFMETTDVLTIPFIYLWDSEDKRRVDGIYGDLPDGMPRLRFPRLFTIKRLTDQVLFDCHFAWGGTRGGFHCGSFPSASFTPHVGGTANLPVVHFGYISEELRQSKYIFYNKIDPGNTFEGEYKHIIGEPDIHAPGPVVLEPWSDQ